MQGKEKPEIYIETSVLFVIYWLFFPGLPVIIQKPQPKKKSTLISRDLIRNSQAKQPYVSFKIS